MAVQLKNNNINLVTHWLKCNRLLPRFYLLLDGDTEQRVCALFISLALESYLPKGIKSTVSVPACSDCSGTKDEAKVWLSRIKGLPLAKYIGREALPPAW